MEHNEERISLKDVPTSTLPPPPRFDAASSAAARPVQPLPNTRIQIDFPLKPKFSRLINKRSKFLALMAIVGLATGAAGGILVVERDKQRRMENSASMIQMPIEQTPASESTASALENNDASSEVSEPVENQVRVRRRPRQPRKHPSELIVRSDAEEEDTEEEDEEEELDRDRDDEDDDKDKNDEDRKKNRERSRKDRERDADSRRSESTRQRAVLHDTMRVRKP
ncbi:MAG TPA: hypothetical protein VFH31_15115 [Pyrinomonadaceae bacterium]|nr:hypothetical protein [Pyrinomonadaceae bacterium]